MNFGGISEPTLWRVRQVPDFPAAIMIGRTPFFDEHQIDLYIDRQPRENKGKIK